MHPIERAQDLSNKLTTSADGAIGFLASSYTDITHIKSLREVTDKKQIQHETAADERHATTFLDGRYP